jgi:hypothetical protein
LPERSSELKGLLARRRSVSGYRSIREPEVRLTAPLKKPRPWRGFFNGPGVRYVPHSAQTMPLVDCLLRGGSVRRKCGHLSPEDGMLDGKRYYRAFPDENPERSRVRAVLDTLQELETQFRKHITQYRPNRLDPKQGLGQTKQGRIR